MNIAHEFKGDKDSQEKHYKSQINLSDFIPEPVSIDNVLRLSPSVKERWGDAIRKEMQGLFDKSPFDMNEKALPVDEIIPGNAPSKLK